jgi:hypothetical protein
MHQPRLTSGKIFLYNTYIGNILNSYMDSYTSPSTKPLYRGTQVVWYIVGLIEVLLLFRFLLKLLAANPTAGFSNFIYSITLPMVLPFSTVFPRARLEGSIFEWTTLLAMLVYWLIGWGIVKIFLMSRTVSTPEAAVKLNQEEGK